MFLITCWQAPADFLVQGVFSSLISGNRMVISSLYKYPWTGWLLQRAGYPIFGSHHIRQEMVEPYCWTAMQGVLGGQGMVRTSKRWKRTTGSVDEVEPPWSLWYHSSLTSEDRLPSYQTPVLIVLAMLYAERGMPGCSGNQSISASSWQGLQGTSFSWQAWLFQSIYLSIYLSVYLVPHFEACDWSTRFMRVISLGLSSVNRFCSTDWEVCEGCVQKCTRLL